MAAVEREIIDAYTAVHSDGVERWTIMTRNPDGTLHGYLLPACTFENLAVEYGLDPDDIDVLLRVAMLQLHIPPSAHQTPGADLGGGRPVTLFTAASTEDARAAHLARVDAVEAHVVRIVAPRAGRRKVQTMAAGGVIHPAGVEVEVDAAQRLAELKAGYRPDPLQMAQRRVELRRALGRDV